MRLLLLLLSTAGYLPAVPATAQADAPRPAIDAAAIVNGFGSPEFDPDQFKRSWAEFYDTQAAIREADANAWSRTVDSVLVGAVLSNSSTVLQAVLEVKVPGSNTVPMFNVNRALYKATKTRRLSDDNAAKMVRVALNFGASPFMTGIMKGPYANLTAVEIAVIRRKPLLVEAFLSPPSPASFEALEEQIQLHPELQREIEIKRTRLARTYSPIKRDTRKDDSPARTLKAMLDGGVFVFAQSYLASLLLLIAYLTFVVTLMSFLFQLRVKQVPNAEVLLTPREDANWWGLLYTVTSTITTTVPTSNPLEIVGFGLAWFGGVVWSQLWTKRSDLGLCLTLVALAQSMLTLVCYLSYAPSVRDQPGLGSGKSVDKIMMYPKQADWSRAIINSAYYVASCGLTYFILFGALDPVRRMYSCPTPSVSDTYGFEFTLTRTVATMWDILIFFSFALRVYRAIMTVVAFDLFARLTAKNPVTNEVSDAI